jgi:hypothetical protein
MTAAEKAKQGEWWADEVKNEGCYGSGDDWLLVSPHTPSMALTGKPSLIHSTVTPPASVRNTTAGHVAWDETAQRITEFIALANLPTFARW